VHKASCGRFFGGPRRGKQREAARRPGRWVIGLAELGLILKAMAEDPRQARLAEIEQEKGDARAQMARLAQAWVQAVAEWVRGDWEAEVQRAIQRDPEAVKRLSVGEGLSNLKQQLRELSDGADAKAAELLNDPALWSHLQGTVFESEGTPKRADLHFYTSPYNPHQAPKAFDDSVRLLKGEVLALLDEAGLLDSRMREAGLRRSGDRYRYPFGFDWSEEMRARMKPYSDAYERFVALEVERQDIESRLQREEAERLWNEA